MVRFLTVLCLLAVAFMVACDSTSEQRIAQLQSLHDQYQQHNETIVRDIQIVEGIMAEAAVQLAEARAAGDDAKASQLEQILHTGAKRLRDLREAKEKIDPLLVQWREHLDQLASQPNLNFGHELQAIGYGVREVSGALPNPANTIAYIAGAALIGIGGIFAKRKDTQAKIATEKAQSLEWQASQIVHSIDKARIEDPEFSKAFDSVKSVLQTHQSPETRKLVDHVQGKD